MGTFKNWQRKLSKSVSLSKRIWMVPRENNFPEGEWAAFKLGPSQVESWPSEVDPDSVWLYDGGGGGRNTFSDQGFWH